MTLVFRHLHNRKIALSYASLSVEGGFVSVDFVVMRTYAPFIFLPASVVQLMHIFTREIGCSEYSYSVYL